MFHRWEDESELPRFVALLRFADGPVSLTDAHCGETLSLEELEELEDENFFNPAVKARCILSCHHCGHIAWAWFD
jgi:hypothetical protein